MSRHEYNREKEKNDNRNLLICHAIEIIKKVKPKYIFIENVPEQLNTLIFYNNNYIKIPEYLNNELGMITILMINS